MYTQFAAKLFKKAMASKSSLSLFNSYIPDQQMMDSIKKASSHDFPLAEFPKDLVKWLEAMAFSVHMKPEFFLVAAMSVVSTLMGPKTKLSIRPTYSEQCNLFTVCLSIKIVVLFTLLTIFHSFAILLTLRNSFKCCGN